MNDELRERLRLADDDDLLDRVNRGMLTAEVHAIALEELHARGRNIETLPTTPPDLIEREPTKATDYSWPLTFANWFLIGVVAFVQTLVLLQGVPNSGDQLLGSFLGGLLWAAGLSLVPLAVIYVLNPKRSSMRIKRTYTITGWCVVVLMLYPLLRN